MKLQKQRIADKQRVKKKKKKKQKSVALSKILSFPVIKFCVNPSQNGKIYTNIKDQ